MGGRGSGQHNHHFCKYQVAEILDKDRLPVYVTMQRTGESFVELAWSCRHLVENPLLTWLRTLDVPPQSRVLLGKTAPLPRRAARQLMRFRRDEIARMTGPTFPPRYGGLTMCIDGLSDSLRRHRPRDKGRPSRKLDQSHAGPATANTGRIEDPSQRNDFKHKLLLDYVRDNRRRLIMAALSIPAQYVKAGQPDQGLPAWGGFQEWSDLVRNALVWSGLPDPDTRSTLAAQVDDDTALLAAVMDGWPGLATVGEAMRAAEVGNAPDLAAALEELPRKNRRHALGQLLKQHRGRVLNGRKFEKTEGKRPRWEVVSVGVQPCSGSPA